jgi:hypothetical protein
LYERSEGGRSVVNYWHKKENSLEAITGEFKIDLKRPIAVLFPNITWDSALFEKDIGFSGMFDWINTTIDFYLENPQYQLIIRAHPAEVILPGSLRESVAAYILGRYSNLPSNIIVIPSNSNVSSYVLMDIAKCGLSYASTTAIELGIRGIPVVVAGEVHFRNKGFTVDVNTKEEYLRSLELLMSDQCGMSASDIRNAARRYAYFTFFRTSMPFELVHCSSGDQPVFTFKNIEDLLPGKNKSLDIICNGFIKGSEFIYE